LGVSLVAIAAVAVTMTLARHRGDQRQPVVRQLPDDASVPLTVDTSLDDIRAAGL
jgi:hypothetical protein